MENASKALSMAASVLIGVLLVALLIFAYHQFVQIPKQEEKNAKLEQVAEFNKKYEAYNKTNLKGNKLISLINMANDNNKTYSDVPEYQINIDVKWKSEANAYEDEEEYRASIKSKKFECAGVDYGSNGRIKKMTFQEI